MNINHKLSPSFTLPAFATSAILLVPLIAMQFTNEVNWTLSDFIVAGTLLFGTGLIYKLVTRKTVRMLFRIAVGFALFSMLFLIWINLAVGIIGSEDSPGNLMYFAVVAVTIVGALIARFRPYGMSLTMFGTTCAQILVTVIALLSGMHHLPSSSVGEVLAINGLFVVLFITSALLFRYSDITQKANAS